MSIESRYELVLSQETGFAHAVANRIVDKPLISAWMILIPIVFVQYLMSSRELKDVAKAFVREFMLTKKLALEVALEMIREGVSKDDALSARLSAERWDEAEAARKEIRRKQSEEIQLLVDHYAKLLAAEGDSYPALVRISYGDRADYATFLDRLHHAESQVNQSAVRAFEATDGFTETITRTENTTRNLRQKELDSIFPPPKEG